MPDEQEVSRDQVERGAHSKRVYGPAAAWPTFTRFGSIENPDPVMRSRGTWRSLPFIRMLFDQEPILGAIVDQWVAQVNAIDLVFKPGDPNSDISVQMAKDAMRSWKEIEDSPIILDKLLYCRGYGYTPIEKVFGQFQTTGLLGAIALHDVPPWHVTWGPDDTPYFTRGGAGGFGVLGEPIPPGKMMFSRWGSRYTAAGESVVMECYPSLWRMRVVRKLGLQALEILNRPIPWVKYPTGWDDDEIDKLEQQMTEKYKFCVMTPANVMDVEVDWPTLNVAASGGAGRSEMDVINAEVRTLYIKWLGTPQTQNEQNASRGLESVRKEIRDDKTPPASQLRDGWIQRGWLNDLGSLNWTSQPRQIWPICESDTTEVAQIGMTGPQMMQVVDILSRLAMQQMTQTAALEALTLAGAPRPRASLMVQSTVDERAALRPPPPPARPAQSGQQEQEAA